VEGSGESGDGSCWVKAETQGTQRGTGQNHQEPDRFLIACSVSMAWRRNVIRNIRQVALVGANRGKVVGPVRRDRGRAAPPTLAHSRDRPTATSIPATMFAPVPATERIRPGIGERISATCSCPYASFAISPPWWTAVPGRSESTIRPDSGEVMCAGLGGARESADVPKHLRSEPATGGVAANHLGMGRRASSEEVS